MTFFGQLVIGPPGSGKSTYCHESQKLLEQLGRKVAIINLDPANSDLSYTPTIDINELVTVHEVMNYMKLGPNGAMLYCMEFLEQCTDVIIDQIRNKKDHYFLIDCPGQIELYTHHNSVKNFLKSFENIDCRLCCVNVVDSHYCSDAGKFISTLLMSLSCMLHLSLPHVNILSKIDLFKKFGDDLMFKMNYYTEVLDLSYLIDSLDEDPLISRYRKLSKNLATLIEDYSLVRFLPANIKDQKYLLAVQNAVDKANGYVFSSGEERNVQKLLMSVMSHENSELDEIN